MIKYDISSQEYRHQFISKLLESINERETVVTPCIEGEIFLDLLQIWLKFGNSFEKEISPSVMNHNYDELERTIMSFVTTGRIYNWLDGCPMKDRDDIGNNLYCIIPRNIIAYGAEFKRLRS